MWEYTPRQLSGFLDFGVRRRKREYAERLSIAASGARGDPKDIKRILREAEKD